MWWLSCENTERKVVITVAEKPTGKSKKPRKSKASKKDKGKKK
jgi:hypothetical protein